MRQGSLLRERAFTLVEVMVALALLSLVMLATVTGLRTLGNTQVSVERLTTRVDELRTVSSFLRDTLDSAVVGSSSGGLSLGGGTRERTVFELLPGGGLLWKANVLFGESYGGSHTVRVAKEGAALVLRWQASPAGALMPWNKAPSRTLVEGLQQFEVAYRRDPAGPWRLDWDGAGPPLQVRIRIRAQDRYWPDLVMPVRR